MTYTMRVSKPTFDASTDADIRNYSIYADTDNVLIKEKARGSGDVNHTETASISHDLGYIPFYIVYTEVGAGRFRVNSFYQSLSTGWQVNANTTTLEITNAFADDTYTGYKYYLFYDAMN
jgi:hypothetical protein